MNQDSDIDWSELSLEGLFSGFDTQSKIIGYWVLYPEATIKTKFGMHHKPTLEQIANTEHLLGWGWEDAA